MSSSLLVYAVRNGAETVAQLLLSRRACHRSRVSQAPSSPKHTCCRCSISCPRCPNSGCSCLWLVIPSYLEHQGRLRTVVLLTCLLAAFLVFVTTFAKSFSTSGVTVFSLEKVDPGCRGAISLTNIQGPIYSTLQPAVHLCADNSALFRSLQSSDSGSSPHFLPEGRADAARGPPDSTHRAATNNLDHSSKTGPPSTQNQTASAAPPLLKQGRGSFVPKVPSYLYVSVLKSYTLQSAAQLKADLAFKEVGGRPFAQVTAFPNGEAMIQVGTSNSRFTAYMGILVPSLWNESNWPVNPSGGGSPLPHFYFNDLNSIPVNDSVCDANITIVQGAFVFEGACLTRPQVLSFSCFHDLVYQLVLQRFPVIQCESDDQELSDLEKVGFSKLLAVYVDGVGAFCVFVSAYMLMVQLPKICCYDRTRDRYRLTASWACGSCCRPRRIKVD